MFRTEIPLTPLSQQLPPSARVLTLGSCFSDSIGARLTEFKVATLVNPFGTVFNPISACKLLRAAAGEDMDWQQHLVEARGRWQSYDLHAEIGADSPVELLQHVNQLTREVGVFLATADVVVLTLGSAYVYRLRETGELVSNCHKIPADQFDKELLTADEMIAAVAETHAYLRRINPKLRFVLTVSPVRHLKDTLILNSASKAMLRVACHYLSELLPDVTYFPAYELLVDDLRDYRFYATDMLHLSETAENYVWEKFTRIYFDTAFGRFKKEWEGIRQNLNHRPLYPAAPEHRAFLETTLERLRKLSGSTDVRMELLHVERELANLPEPKAPAPIEEDNYDDGEERIDIGSFDDQAAIDEAQPIAIAPLAAAMKQVATKEETPKKEDSKQAGRAEAAKPRLTSQASLIRPGSGLLVEDAEDAVSEAEDVEADETAVSSDSAYDHAYSPTLTELTDEAEADEDDSDDEEESDDSETAEDAAHRKKRRSRGGAKRTKRKHARLAAEQTGAEGQPEARAVATVPAPLLDELLAADPAPTMATGPGASETNDEPASEVVYVTEAELRQPRPRPEATEPAAAMPAERISDAQTEQESPSTDETVPEARRGRNNRRGNKREQAPRYGGRPNRQPLYAGDAEVPAPTEAETPPETAAATPSIAVVEPVMPVLTEAATLITPGTDVTTAADDAGNADKKPAAKKRPARPQATKRPIAGPTVPAEPAPVAISSGAPVTTELATPEPAVAAAAPAKPARRKPAPKPKAQDTDSAAPVQASTPEAIAAPTVTTQAEPATEPAKAPAKKRAVSKPKVATEPKAAALATKAKTAAKAKAPASPKVTPAPKAAVKKASAKAKPAVEAAASANTVSSTDKEAAKGRTKAAAKPRKKAGPEAPEDK